MATHSDGSINFSYERYPIYCIAYYYEERQGRPEKKINYNFYFFVIIFIYIELYIIEISKNSIKP